jgi:hypothetical protein
MDALSLGVRSALKSLLVPIREPKKYVQCEAVANLENSTERFACRGDSGVVRTSDSR